MVSFFYDLLLYCPLSLPFHSPFKPISTPFGKGVDKRKKGAKDGP